jgi:hypothetical protein
VVPTVAVPLLAVLGRAYAPRFVALALPCFAILVGLALVRLSGWARLAGSAAIAIVALVALVPMYGGYVRSDYGQALATVRAQVRPDDAIVLNGPWQDLLYRRYGWGLPPRLIIPSTVPLKPEDATTWLRGIVASYPRIWVIDSATDAADPTGVVAGWLDEHAYPRPVVVFSKALLRPYLTDAAGQPDPEERPVAGDALRVALDSAALDAWRLQPGAEARLRIRGRFDGAAGARRLLARLVAPGGAEAWHWDGALIQSGEAVEYRAALLIPADASAGAYELEAIVYEVGVGPGGVRSITQMSDPLALGSVVVGGS